MQMCDPQLESSAATPPSWTLPATCSKQYKMLCNRTSKVVLTEIGPTRSKARSLLHLAILLLAVPGAFLANTECASVGLSIENGKFVKDGRPFRGVGVNYFDLFSRTFDQPQDTSTLSNLTSLAQAEIPFVRFMCGRYWPAEQRIFLTNRTAFFEKLDRVVRCAETNKLGLIPSLFWHVATVPDLMEEHLDQLGNPESKSIAYIRQYTTEIVTRYRNSPAIWGWEFGNEYNLDCDLPNHASHRPPIQPGLGTPSTRTERDELEFAQLKVAFQAFSETVRKFDPERAIFTGNAAPRTAAWHNVNRNSWDTDSRDQFEEMLLRDNPDPINTLTVHLYPESSGSYPGNTKSIGEFFRAANASANRAGKPLFLGEFGVPAQVGSLKKQQEVLQEFLHAIREHQIGLSAYWVFDFPPQSKDFNADLKGDRRFIFEAIKQLNKEWKTSQN